MRCKGKCSSSLSFSSSSLCSIHKICNAKKPILLKYLSSKINLCEGYVAIFAKFKTQFNDERAKIYYDTFEFVCNCF